MLITYQLSSKLCSAAEQSPDTCGTAATAAGADILERGLCGGPRSFLLAEPAVPPRVRPWGTGRACPPRRGLGGRRLVPTVRRTSASRSPVALGRLPLSRLRLA